MLGTIHTLNCFQCKTKCYSTGPSSCGTSGDQTHAHLIVCTWRWFCPCTWPCDTTDFPPVPGATSVAMQPTVVTTLSCHSTDCQRQTTGSSSVEFAGRPKIPGCCLICSAPQDDPVGQTDNHRTVHALKRLATSNTLKTKQNSLLHLTPPQICCCCCKHLNDFCSS